MNQTKQRHADSKETRLTNNMNTDFWVMEDIFDFSLEGVEANDLGVEDVNAYFQNLEPPPWNDLSDLNLLDELKNNPFTCNVAPQLKPQPSFLCNRAPEVNMQCSTTGTFSSRSISLCNNSNNAKGSQLLQTSSPVSVLGSSSSCSAEKPTPINPKLVFAVKRTRSKSRRRATLNSFFAFPFISLTSSTSEEYNTSIASESGLEINLTEKSTRKKQKRKRNLTMLSDSMEINKPCFQRTVVPRKCVHCEVTETPQWRAGPMGPKTLCNACGVRYRSGRLVPEYRPAASPTFVPSLHSNSHKRIMEMRIKDRQ